MGGSVALEGESGHGALQWLLLQLVFEALLGIHGLWDLLPGHTGPGGHMPGLPPQGRKTLVHTLCHLSGHQWL